MVKSLSGAEILRNLSKTAKKTLINTIVLVVLIAVTLIVLLLSYRELNFANIMEFLRSADWWWIAAAILCMLAFIAIEGFALWLIVRTLGYKGKLHQAMVYSAADVYYSAITPSASGGQPASLYYMRRDGMESGLGGFSLMLYLLAYTAAIFIMGAFALIARPQYYFQLSGGLSQTLVILGAVVQVLLTAFFVICILWSKLLVKTGCGLISLLAKIRIVKRPDKWRERWVAVVEKYSASRGVLKSYPWLIVVIVFLALAQRVAQTLIPCFVCYSVSHNASFIDLFCLQVYVLLGYVSIPLPGGVGAYEIMFLQTYGIFFTEKFILSAMMVSRVISYYLSMIVSGAFTLTYHILGLKQPAEAPTETEGAAEDEPTDAEPAEEVEQAEPEGPYDGE